ncbi:MAG: toll/interleukin-1 receptor domain-containing protein [Syntrophaceae bacterium]
MASINDYFNIDNKHNITIESESSLSINDGTILPIRMFQNLAVGASYFAIQLPVFNKPIDFCLELLGSNLIESVAKAFPKVTISSSRPTLHPINTAELTFCGRIYIYCDTDLSQSDIDLIHSEGLKRGLFIEYFGPSWAKERSAIEKPLAFISHDSRDKKAIAMPLALKLSGLGIPVWFDEFSLKLGDSLRESIERGIKETDYCILIITRNFLMNDGWTKTEFNSVFTKEIIEKKKVMLPIWYDVSKEEVYEYSPSLVDRLAANWSDGMDTVAAKLKSRING